MTTTAAQCLLHFYVKIQHPYLSYGSLSFKWLNRILFVVIPLVTTSILPCLLHFHFEVNHLNFPCCIFTSKYSSCTWLAIFYYPKILSPTFSFICTFYVTQPYLISCISNSKYVSCTFLVAFSPVNTAFIACFLRFHY